MKIDRLIGILSILLQQEKVTAPYLAEKFEVSRRTISRDIEALCKAGIPLVTFPGVNGGISIMKGYKIDSTLLTSADMQAILTGLASLDSVSGTKRYAQLMEKLSVGASDLIPGGQHILIDLSSWGKNALTPKIEVIHEAIEMGKCIRFRYYGPKGESTRLIEPCYLIFHWASWYVWGYCRERKDYRLFKLNRMTDLQQGELFEKHPAPLPELSDKRVFPGVCWVKALVEPKYRWRLIEEFGPDCFTEDEDGRLVFSFCFADRDSILGWILSFQGGAQLLEPVELREKLRSFGQDLQKQYSES